MTYIEQRGKHTIKVTRISGPSSDYSEYEVCCCDQVRERWDILIGHWIPESAFERVIAKHEGLTGPAVG